jgi:phosphoribosyl 1,2-cyclic phosphodiesterase
LCPGPVADTVSAVPVRFTILGSGSSGNCAYLEAGETRLLIDAGFSAKQIRERLASIGRAPEGLTGILVTHEHGDHICGLGTLCSRTGTRIYANRLTAEAIRRQFPDSRLEFGLFETGSTFTLGEVEVRTFSVPHDAMDPVGFLLATDSGNIGFLTDLGHATKLILERVRKANLLVLEANHDLKLLQEDTRRPWSTKQRILSRHGHLSNDAAAADGGGRAGAQRGRCGRQLHRHRRSGRGDAGQACRAGAYGRGAARRDAGDPPGLPGRPRRGAGGDGGGGVRAGADGAGRRSRRGLTPRRDGQATAAPP